MQRLILRKPVVLSGPNFIGGPGKIELTPAQFSGWYWRFDRHNDLLPINLICAGPEGLWHNITLHHGLHQLAIYEHVGVLQWGLDRVIVSSTVLPPYHGRAGDLWGAVKQFGDCSLSPHNTIWATGGSSVHIEHPKIDGGYIHFVPSNLPRLRVKIFIDYPGLGAHTLEWSSEKDGIDEIVSAFSQGWPPSRRAWAERFHWPHQSHVTWPQDYDAPTTLRLFAQHRLADLLGGISLISYDWLLAGDIESYGAGHPEDLELIKRIAPTLHRIG